MKSQVLFVVVASALVACNANPTQHDAQQWAKQFAPTIDAIDASIRKAVTALPRFATTQPDCSKEKGVPAQNLCSQNVIKWLQKVQKAEDNFAKRTLLDLLDSHHALVGVKVGYRAAGSAPNAGSHSLGSVGSSEGPNMKGRVLPKDGFSVGDRRFGWGRGQTSIQFGSTGERYGSGDPVPMLHVTWQFLAGSSTIDVDITLGRTFRRPLRCGHTYAN